MSTTTTTANHQWVVHAGDITSADTTILVIHLVIQSGVVVTTLHHVEAACGRGLILGNLLITTVAHHAVQRVRAQSALHHQHLQVIYTNASFSFQLL